MSNHVMNRDRRRKGSRSERTSRNRRPRPKTFKTEESAKRWAESKGMKKFVLVNLRNESSSSKKIKVVSAEGK